MGRFLLATLLVAILVCVAVILVTLAKSKKDGEKPDDKKVKAERK